MKIVICGAGLQGEFCHVCGQSSKVIRRPTLEILKEAILSLFAFRQSLDLSKPEPNLLTRMAQFHAKELSVQRCWYDGFVDALLHVIRECDDLCIEERRPFVLQAWRSTLQPGIEYMKHKCSM